VLRAARTRARSACGCAGCVRFRRCWERCWWARLLRQCDHSTWIRICVAHSDRGTDSCDASLGDDGSIFVYGGWAPWMSCEWLGDVFFAVVYRVGGLRGLEVLLAVLASAVMLRFTDWRRCVRELQGGVSGHDGVAGAGDCVIQSAAADAGLSIFDLNFDCAGLFRQGKQRAVWLLPILFLVWVNTHGSWIVGLATVALYIVAGLVSFQIGGLETRRWTNAERLRLEFAFLLSLMVIPITPYGSDWPAIRSRLLRRYHQRGKHIGVASDAVQSGRRQIVSGAAAGFFLAQWCFGFRGTCGIIAVLIWRGDGLLARAFLLLFVPFFAPLAATMLARCMPAYNKYKDQYLFNFALMRHRRCARALLAFQSGHEKKSPRNFQCKPCNICAGIPCRVRFSTATGWRIH